jgi:acyl-CoA thioesterase YciA
MRAILAPGYRRAMDTNVNEPAIRVSMLPRDTNGHGTIFGGVLLAYIDQAGAIATRPFCNLVVTVKMNEVVFHHPVYVGDVVSFYAKVVKIGTTSISVQVTVTAERWKESGKVLKVTEAEVVYVNVGEDGRPVPIRKPASGAWA